MISIEFLIASAIGMLVATGIYLILRARTFPVVLGLAMIGYAVNIFLFSMGRIQLNAPAILTGFATTAFIVQLALRSRYETGTDHVDAKEEHPLLDPREDEP